MENEPLVNEQTTVGELKKVLEHFNDSDTVVLHSYGGEWSEAWLYVVTGKKEIPIMERDG